MDGREYLITSLNRDLEYLNKKRDRLINKGYKPNQTYYYTYIRRLNKIDLKINEIKVKLRQIEKENIE